MGAQSLGVHGRGVEAGSLTGGIAEENDAAVISEAGEAFEGMVAGKAVKDSIDALAIGEFADAHLVVIQFIVDSVGEAELGELGELLRGGGGAEKFEVIDVAELHGGGAHASGCGMDEDAGTRFVARG